MSADDSALIERVRTGDRDAFGALVKRYQRRVYATAFHMTGQHSDADDVAQETFVRAFRGLRTFDGRCDFYTWLHRITVNVALNHLRARRRGPTLLTTPGDTDQKEAGAEADPRAASESREAVTVVLRALGELSPSLRVTLILATVEDMPYKEIAHVLSCPEGTVAWRVNQARKLLRQRLAGMVPGANEGSVDEVLRRTKEALGLP
jgi:RNA polymerase sigma-70 factor, ECF subfamily